MSTPSADTAIRRWADIVQGKTTDPALRSSNVFVRDDRVYSYGSHFELARPLRDKRKRIRGYLFNGDTAASTGGWRRSQTGEHQRTVRNALEKHDVPKVILPHSALEAAGVDFDSVHAIHVTADRSETRKHRTTVKPEGAVYFVEPIFKERPRTREEMERVYRNYYPGKPVPEKLPDWLPKTMRYQDGEKAVLYTDRYKRHRINVTRDEDGRIASYEWETYHHWLGQSLIKARVRWTETIRCKDCGGWGQGPYTTPNGNCPACNGRHVTYVTRHRWTKFLSGFDHQEPNPLYFLCELPYHCQATTVDEAYEALKPVPVKLAEQMGRSYTRQGDIFAIPAPSMTDKQLVQMGARMERRHDVHSPRPTHFPHILGTNHTATEVAYLPGVTLARGLLYHDPGGRERDHIRRKMGDGKTWHVVVKNTVPTSTRR